MARADLVNVSVGTLLSAADELVRMGCALLLGVLWGRQIRVSCGVCMRPRVPIQAVMVAEYLVIHHMRS